MMLRPIGIVKSEIKEPSLVVKSGDLDWHGVLEDAKKEQGVISEILIYTGFTGILDGLEDFSHLLVLYWSYKIPPEARSIIKVHPAGMKDMPLVGIFSGCSPARPNPICVSVAQLIERKGNILKVKGLDALDGSPLIDIKPYIPTYYLIREAKIAEWLEEVERRFK